MSPSADRRPVLVDQLVDPYLIDLTAPVGVPVLPVGDAAGSGAVLLLSRTVDAEFTELTRVLGGLGVPVVRIDADQLTGRHVSAGLAGGLFIDGRPVRPTVSWLRRFARTAMSASGPADALRGASWATLVRAVAGRAPTALPGPSIGLLAQLTAAGEQGIRVPKTVVTTDPAGVDVGDPVVVKTLGHHFVEPAPGRLLGVFPTRYTRDELIGRPSPMLPLVVQEYVPHEAEYRIYVLNGIVHGYLVHKSHPAALWQDTRSDAECATPPEQVADAALTLARAWRLTYAAFDFLVSDAEPVFLEANIDGDWRWFETRANDRLVTDTAAAMIRDLHLRHGGRITAPYEPRQRFELLPFLGQSARSRGT